MQLLLEMQKSAAAAAPTGDAAATGRPSAAKPAAPSAVPSESLQLGVAAQPEPAADEQAGSKPVLFGSSPEPAIRSSTPSVADWQSTSGGGATPSQRPYRSSGEVQRWVLLPAEFIAWLRQNRYAVVAGAVATLVVVWLGGAIISRRRYAP